MATKNYQWAAAVTVESGGYQGELISIEQNGVEVFSGSVNISQIPKTFNLPWTTTTNETGSSTYTYTYRDSDTMNNNNSTKVAITVTDEWAVSISKNNVMTVTVHTVMNSAVRTVIGSPSNVNRHIWMRRKSNGTDFNPFPLIDNASTAHTIASNVDMGTYVFSLQPGENAQNATVWWRSTSVGHEGDHIPNIYTDILRVGIHFKNILPKDYVPGKIWNDTSTTVETKTGTNITFTDTVHAPLEDLKVGGDVEQTTYSGKNLCSGVNQNYWLNTAVSSAGLSAGNSGLIIPVSQNTDYTVSTTTAQTRYRVAFSDQVWSGSQFTVYNGINKDGTSDSITKNSSSHLYLIVNATDLTKIQIEVGSTATPFEPYVGGVPSPNPDYPQDINVVTGTQAVTVSNGQGQTQNFTIGLGSTELCKIGDYVDRIVQKTDGWYIQKAVRKYTVTGSEPITVYQNNVADLTNVFNSQPFVAQGGGVCNRAIYNPVQVSVSTTIVLGEFAMQHSGNTYNLFVKLPGSSYTSAQAQQWFANNSTTVYYPLVTETETKITNITLISQLNAIKSFGSYNGDTIISVSGNLASPLTISAKVFSDQGAWLSHNRTNGTAEIYNGLTWPQMRTYDGGVGTGNPPTIEHSDEVWRNQRLIGDE